VTIAAGEIIQVTSHVALGTTAGAGAANLSLWIAYSSGGPPVAVGPGMNGLGLDKDNRMTYGMSALLTGLPAGTYRVGIAGSSTSTNWNSNGNAYTTALVIRP
jgi:hypothetical protein